jgi:hypothetical protein
LGSLRVGGGEIMLMYNARLTVALADEAVCLLASSACWRIYVIPTFHFPQISDPTLTSLRIYFLSYFRLST